MTENDLNTQEKSILCVGMCVLDIIHVVSSYPEEDSDRRSEYGRWQRGGNASNNCTVLAQLGISCEFLGCISTAVMFEFVVADMIARGIRYSNCPRHDCDVPLSSILLNSATNSRTIIHSNPNMPILTAEDFKRVNLNNYRWIHFEGRNPEETIQMLNSIRLWNSVKSSENQLKVSLDMEKMRFDLSSLIPFVDVVFLGKDLALHLGSTDMIAAVKDLRKSTRPGYIIICPWGTEGAAALDNNDTLYTSKAFIPTTVVDTLGAGDSFAAAAIYALSSGRSMQQTLDFANSIAGEKVAFYGYDNISNLYKKHIK